jgi:hypothetical protein
MNSIPRASSVFALCLPAAFPRRSEVILIHDTNATNATIATPASENIVVEITFDASGTTLGGIAIDQGYGNRDNGTFTVRDGSGNLTKLFSRRRIKTVRRRTRWFVRRSRGRYCR